MKLMLTCQDLSTPVGNIRGSVDLSLTLDISSAKPSDILGLATVDTKKMAKLIQENREPLTSCLSAFISGDFEKANSILHKIGGTEADFLKEGGGAAGLGILVFVVIMLYASPAKGSRGGSGEAER